MRIDKVVLPIILALSSLAAFGQATTARTYGLDKGQTPAMEVGANFVYIHANAPPSACGCFSLFGGGGTLVINAPHGISIVADLAGTHANNVSGTSQNITIFNYLFGPRYTYRSSHRFSPYVEALAGGTKELSNYSYVQSANAFAFSAGGGVSMPISRYFGWNIAEADYIYSRLPNAVNGRQNDLRVSTGVIFRFGER